MKKLIVLGVVLTLASPVYANTLVRDSHLIKLGLDVLKEQQKAASQQCRRLEVEIKEFNDENNATNARLADRRKAKAELDEKIKQAREKLAAVTSAYSELQGKIVAKSDSLKNLRTNYFAELRKNRGTAVTDRDAARIEKNAIELKLKDHDNFDSPKHYLEALDRFYELKNKIAVLEAKIVELTNMILKSNPPTQAEVEAEIAKLKGEATAVYKDLTSQTEALKQSVSRSSEIGRDIADVERRIQALSNFEVPAICKSL